MGKIKKGYRPFKIIGCRAHQRPGERLDTARVVYARDAVQALDVYRKKLKGVKKSGYFEVQAIERPEDINKEEEKK